MPGKKLSNYFHFATTESFGRMLTLNEITGLNIPPNSVTRKIHAVMEKRMNMYNWKKNGTTIANTINLSHGVPISVASSTALQSSSACYHFFSSVNHLPCLRSKVSLSSLQWNYSCCPMMQFSP